VDAGGEASARDDATFEEGVQSHPFAAEDAVAFFVIAEEWVHVGEDALLGDGKESDDALEAADGEDFGDGGVFQFVLEAGEELDVVGIGLRGIGVIWLSFVRVRPGWSPWARWRRGTVRGGCDG
jgi:hypothetical protein